MLERFTGYKKLICQQCPDKICKDLGSERVLERRKDWKILTVRKGKVKDCDIMEGVTNERNT